MSDNPVEQVFSDLFRYLEVLETQSRAMLQLLKDKKVVSDKQFAPYLEQAATASDVKWRAARTRMEHLFAALPEPAKTAGPATKDVPKKVQTQAEASEDRQAKTQPEREVGSPRTPASAASGGSPRLESGERGIDSAGRTAPLPKGALALAAADHPTSGQPTPEATPPQPKAASDSKGKDAPKESGDSQKTDKSPEAAAPTRGQEVASTAKPDEAASTLKAAEAKESAKNKASGKNEDAKRSDQHPPASKEVAEAQSDKSTPTQPKPAPDTEKEAA